MFRWFLGEMPEFETKEHSDKLIWWVGIVSGLGILFGEYHLLSGAPMTKRSVAFFMSWHDFTRWIGFVLHLDRAIESF